MTAERSLIAPLIGGIALCVLASAVTAVGPVPDNVYKWKPGEIYRFDYFKSILIQQNGSKNKTVVDVEDKRTEVSGVLIIEVKPLDEKNKANPTPESQGISAVLRIDSPKIALPDIWFFSSQFNSPELQKEKNRAVSKAIEIAIKNARWNVTLFSNGVIRYDSRTPASFDTWLSEEKTAGSWRQKSLYLLQTVVERNLHLNAQGEDYDLMLTTLEAPSHKMIKSAAEISSLHPIRRRIELTTKSTDKAQLKFIRDTSPSSPLNTLITLDNNDSAGKIALTLNSVRTDEASAVLDLKIGMLDTLGETYTASMSTVSGAEKVNEEVTVKYKLKRLAPAIQKSE